MDIGIPTEIKPHEGRVALLPDACGQLIDAGHRVSLQAGAGVLSGYSDAEYQQYGVNLAADAAELYASANLIVKVKEPIAGDLEQLTAEHTLFCFLHLAAEAALTRRLCELGVSAIGFETVQLDNGQLPLLAPMSAIAGRVAMQVATHLLHQPMGGRGVLLGGIDGAEPGRVIVLGAGVAGSHAARLAAAAGAAVTVFDINPQALQRVAALNLPLTTQLADTDAIAAAVTNADIVIGAVLLPGAAAPKIVSEAMVQAMPTGSVIADIAVDQGGCVATTRPTSYQDPVYSVADVLHFTVTNMPGAVPRTASQALSSAILPYLQQLAEPVADSESELSRALERGVNIRAGRVVHPALQSQSINN